MPTTTLDWLRISPARIETADQIYERFTFQYVDGEGQIVARSGYPILTAAGTLTVLGERQWELVFGDDSWFIAPGKGCACNGSIRPKA